MLKKYIYTFIFILFIISPTMCFALEKNSNYIEFDNWYKTQTSKDVPYQSIAVFDKETLEPLYLSQENKQMPSASLMKLLTAGEFVKHSVLWEKNLGLTYEDTETDLRKFVGPRDSYVIIRLKSNEKIKIKDILASALIGSANNCANKLSKITDMTKEKFLSNMRLLAKEWGMTNTKIADPSGLSLDNLTTAHDMALAACNAFSINTISQYSKLPEYSFKTREGREIKIKHTVHDLRNNPAKYFGAKTGYLTETKYHVAAGYITGSGRKICVAVMSTDTRVDSEGAVVKIGQWVDEMYK